MGDISDGTVSRADATPRPLASRTLGLSLIVILLLAACGGDTTDASNHPSPASDPAASGSSAANASELDCEREGYPCTVAEVAPAVRAQADEYLDRIHTILDGGSYADAVEWVRGQEGVVAAEAEEHELYFRLDGGRPVVVSEILPDGDLVGNPGQHAVLADFTVPGAGGRHDQDWLLDIVGEGTDRERPDNRKSALFLDALSRDKNSGFGAVAEGDKGLRQIPDYNHPDGIRYRYAELVTPASFIGWAAFDAVFVATHGGVLHESWLMTGIYEELEEGETRRGLCDYLLGEEWSTWRGVDCVDVEHHRTPKPGTSPTPRPSGSSSDAEKPQFVGVAVFADFFREHYAPPVGPARGLEKAIIYIAACQGLRMNDIASLLVGPSTAYVGWTDVVESPWWENATVNLLHNLLLGRTVQTGLRGACLSREGCVVLSTGARLGLYDNGADARKLRLYDLASLRDPRVPTAILEGGERLKVEGIGGDGNRDRLEITVEMIGVIDPEDGSPLPDPPPSDPDDDPGNVWNGVILASSHQSPADLYDLHLYVDDELIGTDNLGGPVPSAEVEQLDATSYRYTNTFTLPFDVDPDGTAATLKVVVDLPEGGISDYEIDVTLDPVLRACDLADAGSLNAALGTALQPVAPSATEPEVTLGQDWCAWSEPLYEDWSKSGLRLIVNTPASGPFLDAMWEARPERQVDLPNDPGETHGIEAAFYDPSGTDNPSSITLDDGSVAIAAYANFHFKANGLWITLQPSGAVALEGDLEARLLEVAMGVAERMNSGAAGD